MSKKATIQPLSDNTRKLIIIIAIVLVAVIILSVALALILKTDVKKPADDLPDNTNSSTLPIKNGDFFYSSSDDTGYPRNAVNWSKYTYKDASDFESISSSEKSLMGIINVNDDNWNDVKADLDEEDVNVANPKTHEGLEAEDGNVYMIFNREATTASILSDSASVSSSASVKITVWVNTSGIESGTAVIMIQKSTVSAKSDNWYAYNFEVAKADGWQKFEFFIFNREASTKYIRVSVGLGNVYTNETAEGVLFVDDITYETVTANDYRKEVDSETPAGYERYKIIENEDITDDSEYIELVKDIDTKNVQSFNSFKDFEDSEKADGAGEAFLPFTNRDDFLRDGEASGFQIFKVSQLNGGSDITALRLAGDGITLESSPIDKDHYHISFWVRVAQKGGHQATQANVYVQKDVDGDWKDVDGGSFTAITTSQDVDTDNNCGWVKYDVYLKPSTANTETISILFVLGDKDGYENGDPDGIAPRGSLYVTSPAHEKISYKDYNNASSGSFVKKLNLIGDSASTSVTNGSFSDRNNVGNEPMSWTPAFAGDNAIYKDGKGNELDQAKRAAALVAGSGVVESNSPVDDAQKSVLQISTNGTNFGYISNDLTLSSRSVYVFSVLVKAADNKPFIYLIDNSKERKAAIVARAEADYDSTKKATLDKFFDYSLEEASENANGWVRYYLVYVTGSETATVRIALFNGAIDATGENATYANGTILYDNVKMKAIGTYSFVDDEDFEGEGDPTYYQIKFSANSGYEKAIEDLFGKEQTNYDSILNAESTIASALGAKSLTQPDTDTWKEMATIPEETENNDGEDNGDTTAKTPNEVDWGLLMSVISSVILVAALLIVFVIKLFQKKRPRAV